MCQYIYHRPIKKFEIASDVFDKYDPDKVEHVLAVNGTCENEKLFTPDGIYCYACNNRTVGMVGCKGKCTFNDKKILLLNARKVCVKQDI